MGEIIKDNSEYDVIVVGAGHAGCEAALAAARMKCTVLLLTIDLDKIATLPCSPSIGGIAKGQLVKEIDALGGEMAKIADKTAMQYKTLNTKKGAAIHSTRTQNDKTKYHMTMKKVIESQPGLDIKQTIVKNLIIKNNKVTGINDITGHRYMSRTVILATGTFLSGSIHIGSTSIKAGRAGEFASYDLSKNLKKIGFILGRMKTGTPPRLNKSSINFSKLQKILFDSDPQPFSFFTSKVNLVQVNSFIGYSNSKTRNIVQKNMHLSALYGGKIKGTPARYCPSFEDKIAKFPKKDQHQIILESEGFESQEIYVSGLGNSLPIEVQLELVHSIEGLEEAEIMRPAYAVEYSYINPTHLKPTLESQIISNLYMAGQLNGTSGYEEAGAQGIYAGINAACFIHKKKPFILDRSQAYIGVMIDDLVTRGVTEPYRMFTSRAEYRLLLREDNADFRLSEIGHKLGLISRDTLDSIITKKRTIQDEIDRIKNKNVKPTYETNNYLKEKDSNPINYAVKLGQLLKRNELNYDVVKTLSPSSQHLDTRIIKQIEVEIKYEGYIKKQLLEIKKFKKIEMLRLPENIDYTSVYGLSNELKEKLSKIRPLSLGQAYRIEGMTPAALSALIIWLKTHGN